MIKAVVPQRQTWRSFLLAALADRQSNSVRSASTAAAAFVAAIREGRPAPITFEELLEVSRVSIEVAKYR